MLGDEVIVEHGPEQRSLARVVAIGLDRAVEGIDRRFYAWAKDERILEPTSVVVEWIGTNPFETNDPNQAPMGNYMTLSSLSSEQFVRRARM